MNKDMSIHTIHHPDMLFGQLVRSSIPKGNIASISLPKLSDDFIVITAQDIPGSNSIKVFDETIPLLSGDHIIYKDQPILAIFGPDRESVHQATLQVNINYTIDEEPVGAVQPPEHETSMSWGDCESFFENPMNTIEHTYMTGNTSSVPSSPLGAVAIFKDSAVEVWATTQWPFHVRKTVSEVCGITKRKVEVYQNPYDHSSGGLLLEPSVMAALSTIAAIKTGKPAKMTSMDPVFRPELIVTKKTAVDQDMVPIAEKIEFQIHLGVIPLFADEILAQVMEGVIPIYHLEACSIQARVLTSPTVPRNYFFGFGFSLGLFTSAAHASHIAQLSLMNPANWLMKTVRNSTKRPKHLVHPRPALIKELIERTVERSDFSRKYAVYEMQRRRNRSISTFTGYTRGVGLASGFGVNGFSNTYMNEHNYSVEVTLDVNDQVLIKSSILHSSTEEIWKTIIQNQLGINSEDIAICQGSTSEVLDSGPDILNRDLTVISLLIERCCESIKNQRFKEPLPIIVKRSLKRSKATNDEMKKSAFAYFTWGSLALEIEIDPVSLNPIPMGVWITVSCGHIYDQDRLKKKIQARVLKELQAVMGTETRSTYQPHIDVEFHKDEDAITADPLPNILGLLYAAYTSAITQALNEPFTSIPAGAQQVFEFIGGKK